MVRYNYVLYIHPMEFEWDDTKNRANIRKHGVSFETASRIFERSRLTRRDGRKDYGEDRYISVGAADGLGRDRGRAYRAPGSNPVDLRPPGVQKRKGGLA